MCERQRERNREIEKERETERERERQTDRQREKDTHKQAIWTHLVSSRGGRPRPNEPFKICANGPLPT